MYGGDCAEKILRVVSDEVTLTFSLHSSTSLLSDYSTLNTKMDFIKNAAGSTMKVVKDSVDWDDEEEKKKAQTKQLDNATSNKKDDDDDILSINSEEAEEAGEIVADVFTAGMYTVVTNSAEAYDKYEEKKKKKKKMQAKAGANKKAGDESDSSSSIGSDEAGLAGEIAANVFTMGIYGDVKEGIEEYQEVAKQEEEKKKSDEPNEKEVTKKA